jgi:S1-C subfamily serine protease
MANHRLVGQSLDVGCGLTIVTAAHVALLAGLHVTTMLGERLGIASVTPVAGYDLAIVRTEPTRDRYVAASSASAGARAAVVVWGFPLSASPTASDGSVIATAMAFPDDPTQTHLALDCATCGHGDSGGGVFAADGALLGIVTARWTSRARTVIQAEPLSSFGPLLQLRYLNM